MFNMYPTLSDPTQVGATIDGINTIAGIGGDAAAASFTTMSAELVAMSSDGTRIAVGMPYASSGAGQVRVLEESGGVWTLLGSAINGEAADDGFGRTVAMSSDGTIVAVGGYANDGTGVDAGHVRVFQYVLAAWTQLGSDIDGEAAGDEFGSSVALAADGLTMAVGAPKNGDGGTNAGRCVRVRVRKRARARARSLTTSR